VADSAVFEEGAQDETLGVSQFTLGPVALAHHLWINNIMIQINHRFGPALVL
jgi:hypothetical protein